MGKKVNWGNYVPSNPPKPVIPAFAGMTDVDEKKGASLAESPLFKRVLALRLFVVFDFAEFGIDDAWVCWGFAGRASGSCCSFLLCLIKLFA